MFVIFGLVQVLMLYIRYRSLVFVFGIVLFKGLQGCGRFWIWSVEGVWGVGVCQRSSLVGRVYYARVVSVGQLQFIRGEGYVFYLGDVVFELEEQVFGRGFLDVDGFVLGVRCLDSRQFLVYVLGFVCLLSFKMVCDFLRVLQLVYQEVRC